MNGPTPSPPSSAPPPPLPPPSSASAPPYPTQIAGPSRPRYPSTVSVSSSSSSGPQNPYAQPYYPSHSQHHAYTASYRIPDDQQPQHQQPPQHYLPQPNSSGVYDYSPPTSSLQPRYPSSHNPYQSQPQQPQQPYYPPYPYPSHQYYPDPSHNPYPVYHQPNPYGGPQHAYSPQNPYSHNPYTGGYYAGGGYYPGYGPQGPGPGGGGYVNGNGAAGYQGPGQAIPAPSPSPSHSSTTYPIPLASPSPSPSPYPLPLPPQPQLQPNPSPTYTAPPFPPPLSQPHLPPPTTPSFLSPPLPSQVLSSLSSASASPPTSPRPTPTHTSSALRRTSSASSSKSNKTILLPHPNPLSPTLSSLGKPSSSSASALGVSPRLASAALAAGSGGGMSFGEIEFGEEAVGVGRVPGPLTQGQGRGKGKGVLIGGGGVVSPPKGLAVKERVVSVAVGSEVREPSAVKSDVKTAEVNGPSVNGTSNGMVNGAGETVGSPQAKEDKEKDQGTGGLPAAYIFTPSRPLLSPTSTLTPRLSFRLTSSVPQDELQLRGVWSGELDVCVARERVVGGKEREQVVGVAWRGRRGTVDDEGLKFGEFDELKEEAGKTTASTASSAALPSTSTTASPSAPSASSTTPSASTTSPTPAPPSTAPTSPPPAAARAAPKSWASLLRPSAPASSTASHPATPSSKPSSLPALSTAAPSTSASPALLSPVLAHSTLPPAATTTAPGTPSSAHPAAGPSTPRNVWAQQPGRIASEEMSRLLLEGVGVGDGGMGVLASGSGRRRERGRGSTPRGLINTGNMCFANSILQVLAYCTPFTDLFEELGKRLKADLGRRTPLIEAMVLFLQEFTPPSPLSTPDSTPGTSHPANGSALLPSLFPQHARAGSGGVAGAAKKEPFVPVYVYDAMKENKRFDVMQRGHQEDAEEFLGFFLETLHEELLYLHSRHVSRTGSGTPKAVNGVAGKEDVGEGEREVERPVSPAVGEDGWLEVGKKQKASVVRSTESRESAISRIFGGKLRSVLHTPGQKDSVTLEPYQPLQLDISPPSVTHLLDALLHLTQPEIIPGVFSSSRGVNVDATKQVYVESLPPVLVLHMKRFLYDTKEGRVVKKGKAVGYGTEMEVPMEVVSPARRGQGGLKYRLFGVIYHHGTSASGGHYTACVLRQSPSSSTSPAAAPTTSWIHLDDESIEEVSPDQVVVSKEQAAGGKSGTVGKSGREKCAYLLFYERVD